MKWADSIEELLEKWEATNKKTKLDKIDETDEEETETPWVQGSEYERI